MSTKQTTILVVGAGAVGCFYASRLHRPPDVAVSLVARSNYDAICGPRGVRMRTHSFGEYDFVPAAVFRDVRAATATRWDYVVVATKALPEERDDSALLAPVVRAGTVIVLIQNGVGVEAPYRARFPHAHVLSAVTVVSAEQTEPGVVVQNRWTRIAVGPYTDGVGGTGTRGRGDELTEAFVRMLRAGGVRDAEAHDERALQMVRWHKTAINAAMNPSAVLTSGAGNARMAQDADVARHLRECMHELLRGAEAVLGAPVPEDLASPERILESTKRNPDGRPSMLLDWERGAPMELDVILGNPIRLARAKGVEMPRVESMYALLKLAQGRRRGAKL